MLVMTRRIGETVRIGDNITVTVTEIDGNQVKLGIQAPREIPILRHDARLLRRRGRASPFVFNHSMMRGNVNDH